MKKISKIEPTLPVAPQRKKVAAYARVSMETDRMMHSLSTQVSYYSELIQSNPEWQYVGVYADNFISGTSTSKRTEFNRLIEDCEAGKIDIVLVKSISRFARNTVDLLKTVRHLKELGISVRFEKENIDSLSGDGEVMLTLLASFAQEESISISNNVKWGTRKRMEQGIPNGQFRVLGYEWEGDHLVIVPEEAAIVKRIFQNFLDGKSRLETERELNGEGITTKGGFKWCDSNIKVILTNITYTGNLLLQKEFIEDPISKKRKKNRGELPQYFVENTHEAIIDMKTFQYVQDEMARRRELGFLANKSLDGMLSCFSGNIKCAQCGRSFVRSTRKNRAKISQLGEKYTFWECTTKKKNNCPACSTGIIREDVLKKECAKVLELEDFDDEVFSKKVEKITVPETGMMIFTFKDGSELEHHWYRNAKKDSWTEECRQRASEYRRNHAVTRDDITCFTTKIKCEHCGCNFRKSTSTMADGSKVGYWRCADRNGCVVKGLRDEQLRELTADVLGLEEFDDDIFLEQIDHIDVRDGKVLIFVFKDGHTEVREWKFKRASHKHTEEYKAHMRELMKERWTPERREAMGEKIREIRRDRYWNSTGKSKQSPRA